MKILQLQQGSPEWLAHRRTARNASDAPAMMGASPYVTRSQLIRQRATGVEREVDAATQAVFDRGHAVEPALRALAERIIGEDLYPVVAVSDDGYLSASFDGVTLAEDVILEAKQTNAEKQACIARGEIPPADLWQIVQQFAVCEKAKLCIYLVGDGTDEGTARLDIQRAEVEGLIPQLRAGWQQFDADVAAYVPEAAPAPAPVGQAPDALPTLSVVARGIVEFSNHQEFREKALAAIAAVNRDLQTDDDFATAELTAKKFKEGEEKLEAAKAQILGQMADVDAVMRTIDEVAAKLRETRLDLERRVKTEKDRRKEELVQAGARAVREHYEAINATLGEHRMHAPQTLVMDLAAAIKGKKSIVSMRDAIDTAVAAKKIEASQQAERVRACVAVLEEFAEHGHLFADRVQLCATKTPEDLRNLAVARVAEFRQREEARMAAERERIRQEEAARLAREQQEREAAQMGKSGQQVAVAPIAAVPAGAGTAPTAANGAAGRSAPLVKLGDINAAIAPLTITADGLASLGFRPVGNDRSAKLYAADDFPRICGALADLIQRAPARLVQKAAA